VVGDGERVAVLAIAKPELALEIDSPEVVGGSAGGKRSTQGTAARAALVPNETVAVEHGVDGADRGDFDFAGQSADQQFAELTGTPVGLVLPAADDEGFALRRRLVGNGATGDVTGLRYRADTLCLVAAENFVAGLREMPNSRQRSLIPSPSR
jgi:hypothetical protein